MSGSIAAPSLSRVSSDTTRNTSIDATSDRPDADTPAGNANALRYASVSSTSVTTRPVAIDDTAPARVAPCQLSPIASAGTSVDANSPQPKIPRNATSVPEACATSAATTEITTVEMRPQRSSLPTRRPNA